MQEEPFNMKGNSKENIKSKRRMKLITFLLLLITIWTGYTSYHQWQNIKQKEQKLTALEASYQEQNEHKLELEKKILLLQNDDYIADLARKLYFFSKPGEVIFITPDN